MTEELKKAIESAKTAEDKKAVAEKYKDELKSLCEEDLENISGGVKTTFHHRRATDVEGDPWW